MTMNTQIQRGVGGQEFQRVARKTLEADLHPLRVKQVRAAKGRLTTVDTTMLFATRQDIAGTLDFGESLMRQAIPASKSQVLV